MKIKNQLAKGMAFIDGNVRFKISTLSEPIEAWKILIEITDISQKEKSPFKIKVKISNSLDKDTLIDSDIFEFDDSEKERVIIFGNPFNKDDRLVDHIHFEYFDYKEKPLVYMWIYIYEVDEGTREDLFPFSKSPLGI